MGKKQPAKVKGSPVNDTPAARRARAAAQKRAEQQALDAAHAQRLAQIVNLHIAGHSLSSIGAAIGASAEEVDRMLAQDAQRYVRSQPALRVYVRNFISERWSKLLDADWDQASDKNHPQKLEHQDRVFRILDSMMKLHGAAAPIQTEVTVDAAPEAVERLVQALSSQQGLGYDDSIFDVVDAEVVHETAAEAEQATLDAAEMVGESDDEGDDL